MKFSTEVWHHKAECGMWSLKVAILHLSISASQSLTKMIPNNDSSYGLYTGVNCSKAERNNLFYRNQDIGNRLQRRCRLGHIFTGKIAY